MITNLSTSLLRVTLFWYTTGVLVLFLGSPDWAEALLQRLQVYPWVPVVEMKGLATAAAVQWRLLVYWTAPMVLVWLAAMVVGVVIAEVQCQLAMHRQRATLNPLGKFWGVIVAPYSLGRLPRATTPELTGQPVTLDGSGALKDTARVELQGAMKEAVKLLTAAEKRLAEELIQLLLQAPDHYAGLGHGVGLLEHTLNVVTFAAAKVTSEFRLPLLAALAHDVGKLITFQPDGKGGWVRRGLHSRESARILVTLPAFQDLPELHQRALLLAVKYDHAPTKMPELRGERDACTLAMRTISALAQADRKATADEKERHLERLQPEDLLWKDFVDFLREAPVVQRGKKGAANQVNNPPDSPYLFVYEAPWRDAAVRRLPPEVAAALDLSRRDAGKMAKYTRILLERLRKEGLLVEAYQATDQNGATKDFHVSASNPLWDIQSGTGEKAVVLRGIIVLNADDLWKKLNYRISVKSPFPVQILAPNANADGRVNEAPRANREEQRTPEVSDGLKLADVENADTLVSLGLTTEPAEDAKSLKPKARARGGFKSAPVSSAADDLMLGLAGPDVRKASKPPAAPRVEPLVMAPSEGELLAAQEQAELEAALAAPPTTDPDDAEGGGSTSDAMSTALAYLAQTGLVEPPTAADASIAEVAVSADVVLSAPEPLVVPHQDPAPVARAPAPPAAATNPGDAAVELSRSERREGLALADADAVSKHPGLKLGDKYYTEHSRAVQAGLKKPGSRYKGDSREKQLDLTDGGPGRGRRRII